MTEAEYNFFLQDRVQKIQQMDKQYDLRNKALIAFSGGKDSTVLSHIIDKALPDNEIPRVYTQTAIEYSLVQKFINEFAAKDPRFVQIKLNFNLREMLEKYGYPFKSKEHAEKLSTYQKSGIDSKSVQSYLNKTSFGCPKILREQFTPEYKLKCSKDCCRKLKKEPFAKFQKEAGRPISITGIRKAEGGARASSSCAVFQGKDLHKFNPLFVVNDDFLQQYIERERVAISDIYKAPYNFERTGCLGCPFNKDLQSALDTMQEFFPQDRKKAELLWKPVYDEYRRLGYRLKPQEENNG